MNSFGRLFKVTIFGESHGESVGVNIDGCPAGLPLTVDDFLVDIERRKGGTQKGTTPRKEDDLPIFKSGIFNDKTTGAPITIIFENKNTRSGDYEKLRDFPRSEPYVYSSLMCTTFAGGKPLKYVLDAWL